MVILGRVSYMPKPYQSHTKAVDKPTLVTDFNLSIQNTNDKDLLESRKHGLQIRVIRFSIQNPYS